MDEKIVQDLIDRLIDLSFAEDIGITKEQIEKVLNDNELKIEDRLLKIIKKCNVRGGNDNISIAYLLKDGE